MLNAHLTVRKLPTVDPTKFAIEESRLFGDRSVKKKKRYRDT